MQLRPGHFQPGFVNDGGDNGSPIGGTEIFERAAPVFGPRRRVGQDGNEARGDSAVVQGAPGVAGNGVVQRDQTVQQAQQFAARVGAIEDGFQKTGIGAGEGIFVCVAVELVIGAFVPEQVGGKTAVRRAVGFHQQVGLSADFCVQRSGGHRYLSAEDCWQQEQDAFQQVFGKDVVDGGGVKENALAMDEGGEGGEKR